MKVSLHWLKDYLKIDTPTEELCEILTQIGLEVEGLEKYEAIKGGLDKVFIGEVLTCVPHPDSDHLNITTVNVGFEEPLPIVCGAANVAAGEKVVVATVGCVLYDGDESFVIKKSKLRGEPSMGMICAEDELGLGTGHDGIMLLPKDAVVGTPAGDYFDIFRDEIIEIGLTPNRVDGGSHIGVARDLAAFFKQTQDIDYTTPSVEDFKIDNNDLNIEIEVKNPEACVRYSGVSMTGVKVEASPEWLQNRLKAIGLNPINNLVDISNYVLFETGQPLHFFDANKVSGNKVIVQTLAGGTKFTTLDETERELNEKDLMICNDNEPMCIGGVFGGLESGVTENTTNLFIESACFDPVYVRKTARRFGLNTDASFRFERGTDANATIYALKRAAMLVKEICGGAVSSEIKDYYPTKVEFFNVDVKYSRINRLLGKELEKDVIKNILLSLEMIIANEDGDDLLVQVPPYRVDVTREADIIEDILRIYGFNNIEVPVQVQSVLSYAPTPDVYKLRNVVSDILSANGFNEIMNNSLTKAHYYEGMETFSADNTVNIVNPLSSDLNGMRQTLLFGGLESISYNVNRKNPNVRFYEFGRSYFRFEKEDLSHPVKKYFEEEHLGLFISGNKESENWNLKEEPTNFFQMKSYTELILKKLGFSVERMKIKETDSDLFVEGIAYFQGKIKLVEFGLVNPAQLKKTDVSVPVFYADFNWANIIKEITKNKIRYTPLSKFPAVKRDLALLCDRSTTFAEIKQIANNCEKKLLKSVNIFDIYENDSLGENKKSYAISFTLADDEKTLADKQIDKIMQKLIKSYEKQLGAVLR
ncbi:MAG: phenylalanine--tRNA ligase subunit beta [Marinifilaceae bacterium]